jgi:hypothetical protein
MSIHTMRTDNVVYWAPAAYAGDGVWTYSTPVQIKGRWQDVTERRDDIQEDFVSSVVLYPDQDVSKYGWVWKGLLANLPSNDPQAVPLAYRVMKVEYTESSNNALQLWKAIA